MINRLYGAFQMGSYDNFICRSSSKYFSLCTVKTLLFARKATWWVVCHSLCTGSYLLPGVDHLLVFYHFVVQQEHDKGCWVCRGTPAWQRDKVQLWGSGKLAISSGCIAWGSTLTFSWQVTQRNVASGVFTGNNGLVWFCAILCIAIYLGEIVLWSGVLHWLLVLRAEFL